MIRQAAKQLAIIDDNREFAQCVLLFAFQF